MFLRCLTKIVLNISLLFRCIAAKGEEAPECDKFKKYYRSLCPGEWVCNFYLSVHLSIVRWSLNFVWLI
jgi:hypothetical protein